MKKRNGFTKIEMWVVFLILGLLLSPALCSGWTESNLEWLLSLLKEQPVDVPFILALIISVILNWSVIVFNIIIELIRLVVG
jgi:hypothetical protein